MANKLILLSFVLVMLFASTSFAAPPADFLNTEVYAIIPVNGLADGGAPLKRFVDTGLKSGVWKKIAENQWTYRISNVDPVSRKKVDVTLQFIKTPLQEFKGKRVIVLNRVVDRGREYSPRDVYNFFMQIAGNLPPTQQELNQSHKESEQKRHAQELEIRTEEEKSKTQAMLDIFGLYNNESDGSNKKSILLKQVSKDKLKLTIKIVTTHRNTDSDESNYNPEKDIETKKVSCKMDDRVASFSVEKGMMGITVFSALFEEPDCSLRLEMTGGRFLEVKYKGSCRQYCSGRDVGEYGGFSGFYDQVRKQEAKPVNEWK